MTSSPRTEPARFADAPLLALATAANAAAAPGSSALTPVEPTVVLAVHGEPYSSPETPSDQSGVTGM